MRTDLVRTVHSIAKLVNINGGLLLGQNGLNDFLHEQQDEQQDRCKKWLKVLTMYE